MWYDYEYDSSTYLGKNGVKETKVLVTSLIKAFCERMKSHGVAPGLYLNRDYIQNHLNYAGLKQYPLWQAAWTTSGNTSFAAVSPAKKPTAYGNNSAAPDYAALVCKKAGLEPQTKDFINTYKWANFLWEKLWKAMQ